MVQVEHDIGGSLAGAVIGPLAAAPGIERGESGRIGQFGGFGRRAGGVKRRVLDQPDAFRSSAGLDGGDTGLHLGQSGRIFGQAVGN